MIYCNYEVEELHNTVENYNYKELHIIKYISS